MQKSLGKTQELLNKNKLVYSLPEARVVLSLSDSMIRKYLMSGELAGYQIGTHWRIGRDEVLRFAAHGPLKRAA